MPSCPPLNPGAAFGYLVSDGDGQNLLPYPDHHAVGDVMLGFLPWSCQSGYYGDLFQKYSTPPGYGEDFVVHRFIDGTEGTVPQNGRAAYGLVSAELYRPASDLLTGALLRGADKNTAPLFPLAEPLNGGPFGVPLGDGTYVISRVTPSFAVTRPTMVVCACYVRHTGWDSGDPYYEPFAPFAEWYGTPPLELVSESLSTASGTPTQLFGWRVTAKMYAAGATVPAITNQIRANRADSVIMYQSVTCFAQGTEIGNVTRSGGTLTVTGDRAYQATIVLTASAGLTVGTVTYPDDHTWACDVTGYAGGTATFTATDGTNAATGDYPFTANTAPVTTATPAGPYSSPTPVTLSTDKSGRVIYTLDGSEPTLASSDTITKMSGALSLATESTAYFNYEPITVGPGDTLRFRAIGERGTVEPDYVATYPTDTTWEVLVPVSEAPGTFEAVASSGETASLDVVVNYDLAGTAAGQAGASGAPRPSVQGTAAGQGGASATLTSRLPIAGTAGGEAGATATPSLNYRLVGVAAGVAGASAAIQGGASPINIVPGRQLDFAAADATSVSIGVPVLRALAGDETSTTIHIFPSGYTGPIVYDVALEGTAAGVAGASAGSVELVGAAAGVATASGTLTSRQPLAGAAAGQAGASGALSVATPTAVALEGQAAGVAGATGDLDRGGPFVPSVPYWAMVTARPETARAPAVRGFSFAFPITLGGTEAVRTLRRTAPASFVTKRTASLTPKMVPRVA